MARTIKKLLCCSALLALAVPAWAGSADTQVRLAVVIVVDQMRPDYLDRFGDLYTGGLARLLRDGAVFRRAYHDHSCTLTGPGHATLSTGCFPSHHGVVGNDWYDRALGREVYCCDDSSVRIAGAPGLTGVSPRRLQRPTVAELLKRGRPGAKVVSVGLKDRSAILSAGNSADAVLWYETDLGRFVTSTWYDSTYSSWLEDFHASGRLERFADSNWERLLPDSAYARSGPDRFPNEHDGKNTEFPHPCNPDGTTPGKRYYRELYYLPFGDQIVLELAGAAATAMRLGQDSIPDLLLVECSAADAIGHRYGPNSHEVQDYYLRLDRYLGDFFDALDTTVETGRWFVAVAADHGVMPLPEFVAAQNTRATRVLNATARAQIDTLVQRVSEQWGSTVNLLQVEGGLAFTPDAWRDSTLVHSAGRDLAARLRTLDWIADVYTRWELEDPATPQRPYLDLIRHAWHAERGPDLYLRESENTLISSRPQGTTHGTVYTYDTQVPLLFMGPGVSYGPRSDSVRTVDLAPTLCDWLGVPKSDGFDGVTLVEKLKTR